MDTKVSEWNEWSRMDLDSKNIPVIPVTGRIDDRIDDTGGPGHHRGDDVQPGIRCLAFVVHHIGQHERQEADEEAQKDGDHHHGQPVVLARLSRTCGGHIGSSSAWGASLARSTGPNLEVVVAADLLLLMEHRDVDAGVRNDDHQAGQQETDQEEGLLDRLALLLEDRAGEGGLVQSHLAPDTQNGRQLRVCVRENGLVLEGSAASDVCTYQEQKGDGPHEEQLQRDELGLVDLRIAAVASDEYVSVGGAIMFVTGGLAS